MSTHEHEHHHEHLEHIHEHDHEEQESCCCDHDHHEHEDGCYDHDHHEHEDGCCDHDHHEHEDCCYDHDHHEHEDGCCDHDHHNHDEKEKVNTSKAPLRIYQIENLDCANCAAKVERKLQNLDGVEFASITFATKQLRVASYDHEALLPLLEKTISEAEPGVTITLRENLAENHSPQEEPEKENKDLVCIIIGALLLLTGAVAKKLLTGTDGENLPFTPLLSFVPTLLFIAAYLLLGLETIFHAAKNLLKGKVLDENFLMSIATIGAFAIGDYPEAVGVMLFYRIGEWFEEKAVKKSRSQIMEALDMRPENVLLSEGEGTRTIPAKDAAIGDIILVRPGDRIPLDGIVVEGESRIDTAPITGEPVPILAKSGTFLYSGCVNTSSVIKMKVEKPLSESMVTKILDSVENAAAGKPSIDRFITRFSRIYTPFVVISAILIAIIPSLITGDYSHWIYTALTFLVISCPCALVLSVPLAFFAGIGAGSKKGILFKSGLSLEMLNTVKAVVMDKTGTLTKGNFTVQKILPINPEELDDQNLLRIAASCEQSSTHPIALSIMEEAARQNITEFLSGNISEISGHGIVLEADGSTYLCGNGKLMTENNIDMAGAETIPYGSEIFLAKDGIYIGCLLISDTLKEDAKEAISELKKNKLKTAILTGDTEENTKEVADAVGIDMVYARLLPEEKLGKLKSIRESDGAVMFVGDGINDAVVLAGADVGAAMGSGADAAMEAADVVFLHSNLSSIPLAYKLAKIACRISHQNVVFAIAVKFLIMILGICGIASMWLAVFADTGVAILCILNSIRILYRK
ncbi:MAG: heavy metal translocating P-type ATPase [Lachnospiraceae bacterium]